jgi:hypothetical protein
MVPILSFIIVVLVIVLVVLLSRGPKTITVESVCPSTPSGDSDGILGISFTRGENEILDFVDNVENRSSETLRSILCSIISDEQFSKLVAGPNTKMSCKDATARLEKIKDTVQAKVNSVEFKSDAVKTVVTILSEEMVNVYEKIKARLCTSDDVMVESKTIMDMIKDARTKFCKNAALAELKPIFEDITRIRSGKLT